MSNYRVVLQHSIPAEPITGRQATPGIWAKFENGIADVRDERSVEMMLKHPAFGIDFVVMEDEKKDPYLDLRDSIEPEHNITEIKYGHVEGSVNPKPAIAVNRETKKVLMDMAKGMAKEMAAEMAPDMAKKMLKEVLSQNPDLVKGALAEASAKAEETEEEDVLDLVEDIEAPKPKKGATKVK